MPRWTEPVDHCNLPCKSDPTAICGGSAALTAYVSESVRLALALVLLELDRRVGSLTLSAAQIPWVEPVGNEQLASYGDYTYQGCTSSPALLLAFPP